MTARRQPGERPASGWGALGLVALVLMLVVAASVLMWRRGAGPQPNAAPSARPTVRVTFWNLRDLSAHSRTAAERRAIVKTLQTFDAIAIAEVQDTEILPRLAELLDRAGHPWKSYTSAPVGETRATTERYGLLYRDDIFDLRAAWQLPDLNFNRLDIGRVDLDKHTRFDREPLAVVLATDDGRLDFALVVVHVTYGEHVGPRIAEVRALGTYYQLVRPREPDVLIAGDFNRNAADPESLGWLCDHFGLIDTTRPDTPTVIRGGHTYDHILLSARDTTEYTGRHGVTAFDQTQFHGDTRAATRAVSDHRPVWIELAVPATDDD